MNLLTREHIHANLLGALNSEHVKMLIENLTNALVQNQEQAAKIAELEAKLKSYEVTQPSTPQVNPQGSNRSKGAFGNGAKPRHAHV